MNSAETEKSPKSNEKVQIVYETQKFRIIKKGSNYFIVAFFPGIKMTEINEVIVGLNIEVTNFMNLRAAIANNFNQMLLFGVEKDKITLTISTDEMKVYVKFEMSDEELQNVPAVIAELEQILKKNNITYGINIDDLKEMDMIPGGKNILIASGKQPVHGDDSVTKVLDVHQIKPKIREDGSVDHFDLGIIHRVKSGDWVAEWTKETCGEDGINVKNNAVSANKGKAQKISYDKKSIRENDEGDKVVLYASRDGSFKMERDGKISVANAIVVDNIDYTTGNIDFDGFVTVKGTVADGFSIIATEDVEILSSEGIGCVKEIISKRGKVLIRGGINGRDKSMIHGVEVHTKYITHATIEATRSLFVSNYILNSHVTSPEIFMASAKSFVAGGEIHGVNNMLVGNIGLDSEAKTVINLQEIDKELVKKNLQDAISKIEENKVKIFKIDKIVTDGKQQQEKADDFISLKYILQNEIDVLEEEIIFFKKAISQRGDANIRVLGTIFPNVVINSKSDQKVNRSKLIISNIYVKDRKIMIE